MGKIPKKYTANLSRKDKKKQIRSIKKAQRSYRKRKGNRFVHLIFLDQYFSY